MPTGQSAKHYQLVVSLFCQHTHHFSPFDRFGFRIVEVKNAVWSSSTRSVLAVTFSAILVVQCVLSGQACRLNLKTVLSQWYLITTMDSATFPVSLSVFFAATYLFLDVVASLSSVLLFTITTLKFSWDSKKLLFRFCILKKLLVSDTFYLKSHKKAVSVA